MSIRVSVRKRYVALINLVAAVNQEGKTSQNVSVPIFDSCCPLCGTTISPAKLAALAHDRRVVKLSGYSVYTLSKFTVDALRNALRKLARARVPDKDRAFSLPAPAESGVLITSDGRIRVTTAHRGTHAEGTPDFFREVFLRALDNCEVQRIRECPICRKLFVALRLDQQACSRKCGNAHRAREFRIHSPKYEQTRQINRLVRGGMQLDEAKAEVQRKGRKRRTVQ